jgi:hypothetical protein
VVHIAPHRELVDMAWIERKTRSDGGTSAVVRWRLGGTREGRMQTETFGAGSDDQNLARADGFRRMVVAAGITHVRQVVNLSPGHRKRYLAHVRTLASVEISGADGPYRPFDRTVAQVKEADVRSWPIGWDRSLKSKANY